MALLSQGHTFEEPYSLLKKSFLDSLHSKGMGAGNACQVLHSSILEC